ncbi:TetR family transcriptional regulator [Paenibacillus farraposensis]|uniref:TetR family transcriptional regulator n=1 Tax=Paenibacillus farraposensis TaxID=2807095 RepID=A0ABW4D687_9BACL|nr:TetR family transcriptional regulator [Paenibacillus farraposensis]MCC3381657.1 TetR family transcriptional regulator [Paenibacillus farraposensis]
MAEETLTKERILDTAESVLRKFGFAKANMSDIARAIGVSHAAIYRYFENKAMLQQAVVERWMNGVFEPLAQSMKEAGSPETRLYHWLSALRMFKRERARQDPELFAMYARLVADTPGALEIHIEHLLEQLQILIEDGKAAGIFICDNPRQAALGVFLATTRFHHAAFVSEWEEPEADSRFEAIWHMLLRGLSANR